jgi:histone H1/5
MAQFSSDRPRTSEMVFKAISNLKGGGGSSMQAIKKYIAANYKIDSHKMTFDINKFLKAAVASGDLVKAKEIRPSSNSRLLKPATEEMRQVLQESLSNVQPKQR